MPIPENICTEKSENISERAVPILLHSNFALQPSALTTWPSFHVDKYKM